MAEVTQAQVVDYIKGITVLELSQLVKALEQELGVSAAAAMPMAMPMAGGGGGAAAAAEEKTEFTVTLTDIGGNKINVIKEGTGHWALGTRTTQRTPGSGDGRASRARGRCRVPSAAFVGVFEKCTACPRTSIANASTSRRSARRSRSRT